MSIYDYNVKDAKGQEIPISTYKGKVLLIVNTATACGFTPQYRGLQSLYEKYNYKGLEILDFPCNQFGNQAKESNEEIQDFCHLKYKTTFTTFAKIEVNGDNEHPLYTYLKEQKHSLFSRNIKWNFTKFLVTRDGKVVNRYSPQTTPEDIEQDILDII
mgnify:CR=1 FL=1